jgi:heme oxygenase (biliverdin-IX-beta and delta-forming)
MFMERLRQETSEDHLRLEERLGLPDTVKSLEDYETLLLRFTSFYEAVEAPIHARLESIGIDLDLDLRSRRKLPWLHQDLKALGLLDATVPALVRPQIHESVGAAFGALYVIEGSTLGSRFLSRFFKESLGLTLESGLAFFSGYGPDTSERWKTFKAWGEAVAHECGPVFQEDAVRSARLAFSEIETCLLHARGEIHVDTFLAPVN